MKYWNRRGVMPVTYPHDYGHGARSSRVLPIILLAFVIQGFAACATPRTTLITGETILVMGQTFVDTGEAYNTLHDQGIVSDEEYRDWAKFAKQFMATYRPLVNLYKAYATGESQDKSKETQIAMMLSSLNQELLLYLLKTRGD